jgi:hypothetical protein
MKLHRNAKLSVQGRKLLIERIEFAGVVADAGRRGDRSQ